MNCLNPLSKEHHAYRDLVTHFKNEYNVQCTTGASQGRIFTTISSQKERSRLSKALIVAQVIAILIVSISLFPVGVALFRILINRITLQKVTLIHENGDSFKGTTKFGTFYEGLKRLKTGELLKGRFNQTCELQKGKITYPQPDGLQGKYVKVSEEGQFNKNGKLHGKGKEICLVSHHKVVIKCDYRKGVRHGYGTRTDDGRLVYKGEWQEGYMQGKGEKRECDGSRYVGQFEKDRPNGQGHYKSITGYTYSGEWLNGEEQGIGKATTPDKRVLEGRFEGGMLVDGKITTIQGRVFEGTWNTSPQLDKTGKFWIDRGDWFVAKRKETLDENSSKKSIELFYMNT